MDPATSDLIVYAEMINIRPMRSEDIEQVVAIDKLSFSMPWPASSYRYEMFENPLSLLWVAEAVSQGGESRIAGMVVVWLILDEAHIATIAVHPDARGQGIARQMLKVALDEAIARGMRSATLEVRANNIIAQRLYHRFGFEVVGRRPRYYRDNGEDALIMTASGLDEAYRQWLTIIPNDNRSAQARSLELRKETDHES